MRHERHREAEMEARGIPHRGFAERQIGMQRERRLHVGEGRDDDAPDAFDGIERQDAAMTLRQPAHHVGLARRPECGADFLGLLDRDQAIDDVAALHQQVVNLLVDGVDFFAQLLQGGRRRGCFGHGCNSSGARTAAAMPAANSALIGKTAGESKENIDGFCRDRRPEMPAVARLVLTKSARGTNFSAVPWSFEPAGLQPR